MSEQPRAVATGSQTIGPFFHVMPGCDAGLERLVAPGAPGEHITLRIHVLDGAGTPVPDALVELWQADASGTYPPTPGVCGFGRRGTDADGCAAFETIRPGAVSDGCGGYQAPHVNVLIFARGLLRHLHTRVYFEGDPGLAADPVLQIVPEARRMTLVARPGADGAWEFVVRLQGEQETVFFDV